MAESKKDEEVLFGILKDFLTKAKPLIKEEEANDIIRCIKDAKRVHPDWVIDDVISLLEFREETKQALKRRSNNGRV